MNINYFKTIKGRSKRFLLFIMLMATWASKSYAQVNLYTFAQSSGTYITVPSPTTVHASGWDDETPVSVTIPWTFSFNGTGYTTCYVNSNGYITFGATSTDNSYTPISSTDTYAGAVSGFGRDLVSNSSTIVRGVAGTAPNRVFIIQWNNARRYSGSAVTGDVLNFQIRLYENGNKVELMYGACSATSTSNSIKGQVGLRGATNSDFDNRSGGNNTAWASTSTGTSNTDDVNYKNGLVPASGLTFTWTPPACFPATATAGTAITTCSSSGAVNITAGSSATNNSGITWTCNGTGTFTNANSLTLCTYTPSAADIAAGSRTLTLTATGNTPCANATSTKTITINSAPTAVSGTTITTCSSTGAVNITAGSSATNNAGITWSTSNGTGTFANSTSLTTCTYTPSAADISAGSRTLVLTATALSGCTNATSSKSITITAAATSVAGTAVATCSNSGAVNVTAGSSSTNNAGITWSCNGTGTFANANSLTLCTYTPSAADIAAGTRTLTLTATGNSPCGNVTSTKTLTISQPPTSTAGNPVTTCASTGAVNITSGATASNQASVTWTSSGTGTFANANSLTTCTYNPSALDISNGSVTLTLTVNANAGCTNATSTKTLTIVQAATAVAGTAISNCGYPGVAVNVTAGSSSANNNGITWTCNGTGTFANANSLTLCTYTPSAADIAAGSRTLTLTATGNSPCGNITSTKTISFIALPSSVSVTPSSTTVCASATSTALTGAATTVAANALINENFNGTSTFTAAGTNSGGGVAFSQQNSGYSAGLTTITNNDASKFMIATASSFGSANTNSTLTSPIINTSNYTSLTFTFRHTYQKGSEAGVSVQISTNGGGAWSNVNTSGAIIVPNTYTGGQGANNNFVTATFNLTPFINTTSFRIRFNFVSNVSFGTSWWAIDDAALNGAPLPMYSWTSNTGSGLDGLPGGSGTPSIANKNITVVPTATTVYTVIATDQVTGCTNTSTSTVTVNPVATVSAGSTQTICSNETATMNGAFGGGASSAAWSTSGTGTFNNNNVNAVYTPSLADINAGSVVLTYTTDDPAGPCGSVNASMTLNINKVPAISSHPSNVVVCENGNATFTVGATGTGLTYQWRRGTTDLVNGGTISGALSASLTITGVVVGDAASDYNCVVSGTCAPSVTSNNASLTVNTIPVISSNGNLSVNTAGNCNAAISNAQLLAQVISSGSPAPTVTFSPVAGNFNVGTTLVTATAQNTCGSVQTTFNVIVTDNENPGITCPATANITADAGLCTSSASIGTATATDNCTVASVVASPAGPYSIGTHTITWTATDNHGNIATCTQTVNVTDNQNPVISNCPSNINLNNDGGLCTAVATWTAPTAADNCGVQSFTSNHNSGDAFPVGTTVVTYTATDVHGNVATCSFNVVVTDNELPVISNCPSNISLNNDAGLCTAVATWTAPTAADNCGMQSFTSNHNSGDAFAVGTTVVTYTATDIHGNVATCSFNVVVTDNELPVITCPATANITADAGLCNSSASIGTATATDNCSVASVVASPAGPYSVGSHTITWTATDSHGNIATCTQTVNVSDNENPVITCPATANISADAGLCTSSASIGTPTTSDNCGVASVVASPAGPYAVGTTSVTWTVTDVHGNTNSCVQSVIVSDTELPVISNCPATINLNNDAGLCSAVATWIAPTVADNCGIQSFTSNHNSGDAFAAGTTVVTYTATDVHGNVATCSFNVVVTDNELPVITCPATANISADAGLCTSSASIGTATATDNCSVASVVASPAGPYTVGSHTITWTATDNHGNIATCTQTVNVTDNENPVITCPATANIVTDAGMCTSTSSIGNATATDNCSVASVVASPAGPYTVGAHTITWTATDIHGNISTCTQTVNVTDGENPVAVCQNITVQLDVNHTYTVTAAELNNGSTDNCGVASVSITNGQITYGCSDVGNTYPVTISVADAQGNIATCVANVTVAATINPCCTAPVISCAGPLAVNTDAGVCGATITNAQLLAQVASVSGSPAPTVTFLPAAGLFATGTTSVTATATNGCGVPATCTFNVTVTDNENPVITCPATANISADAGLCTSSASIGTATATDNCSVASVVASPSGPYSVGSHTITWTATDVNGNTATCTQTVNVTDNENPVITCPATANISADAGLCTSSVSIGTATATDNCSVLSVVASPAGPYSLGTHTITWTATDVNGNTATCTQTVNVSDNENPVIIGCPSNITVNNTAGTCGAVVNYTAPTATDNCSGAAISGNHNSGETFPTGTTTVTYTATDASGNTATCSFTVTVNSTAPAAPTSATSNAPFNNICAGNNVMLTANGGAIGSMGGVYKWYTGSCGGTLVGTGATITQSPVVTTTYFVRVEDNCGNTSACASITISLSFIPDSANVILPFSGMPSNVCTGTTANLSIAPVAGATYYVWDVPAGGYFNGNTSNVSPFTTATPNVQVTYGTPVASLYVTGVQAGNACGTSVRKQQKTRGTTSVPASVSGPLTACPNSTITYSTGAVAGGSSYLWTITGNATVTGTSTSVTVNFGPTWNGGTLCVSAQTSCYTSPSKCITISKSAAITNALSGSFTACPGSVFSYSVAPSSGAASYNWTVPTNASVTGGQGTANPTVTFASNYNNTGSICVTVTSICGVANAPKCKSIAPGIPSVPNSINGPANGLCNQTVVYTCPNQAGVTFTWTAPSGASITAGQGTNSVSIQYGTFTTGAVTVKATNGCGSSALRSITVKGAPNKPTSIAASPGSWCDNTSGIEFVANTSSITGSYVMTWSFPGSNVATYVLGGGNSNGLVLDWITGNGTIMATSYNACGSGTAVLNIGSTCREAKVNSKEQALSVFPNPTTGLVNIRYQSAKGNTSIQVTDLAGRMVLNKKVESIEGSNNLQLDLTKFAKGAYMLSVKTSDITKQVKIVVE